MRNVTMTAGLLLLAIVVDASPSRAEEISGAAKVSGIDQALFSDSVKPGDNFYRYANQVWLDTTAIPGDKSNYGIFSVLDDETREQVKALIEVAAAAKAEPGTAAQKVGDLYNATLNTDARDAAGIEPIRPMLEWIGAASDKTELASVMGRLIEIGVVGPFAPYVGVDARDSDSYAVYMTQTGLTMPDRDYYLNDEPRYEAARKELKRYISDLFADIGVEDPDADAAAVMALETKIAKAQWTKTENRDPVKTYDKQSFESLDEILGEFDLAAYAKAAAMEGVDQIVSRQTSYFKQVASLYESEDLDVWKQYLRLRLVDGYAESLSSAFEQLHFDFHGRVITGTTEQEPLWKRAVGVTGSVVGELVGQLYVEKHFRPEAKQRMNELVGNLKRAFAQRIESRDWMGKGTQKQALEKLSLFTTKIGYPDEWKDYEALAVESDVLAEILISAAKFEHARELAKLGGPIDRNEWHMTPQTINAYYNPTMNEIVFPAAILQPPFFNLMADDAVNYGAIGAVIGHEISHGFDDKGSQYDGKGNLRMWWTEDDRTEFDRRAKGLVDQYAQYEPIEGNYVNGELTLGENIGDLGGLSVAYEAYRLAQPDGKAPVIDGLTGDQRFFLGWSQIWRRLYRKPELLKRLVTDPHSPSEFRVNGIVRNMDAWYDAFDVKAGDALYLAPEDRVRIW